MKPYPVREATSADLNQIAAVCTLVQDEHFANLRKRVVWDDKLKATILDRMMCFVVPDGAVVRAVLLMQVAPPRANILVALPKVTIREQQGMFFSLLIAGYQPCADLGVTVAGGQIIATQKVILDALKMVDTFRVGDSPWEVPTTVAASRKAMFKYAETAVDATYLAALERALKAL